jgi:hypothetical protein
MDVVPRVNRPWNTVAAVLFDPIVRVQPQAAGFTWGMVGHIIVLWSRWSPPAGELWPDGLIVEGLGILTYSSPHVSRGMLNN